MAINFQKNKKVLIHVAFWCVYASFFFYQWTSSKRMEETDWGFIFQDLSFHIVSMLFICYINYFYFLPRFLKNKNLGRYLLEFLPVFAVFSYFLIVGKQFIFSESVFAGSWVYTLRFSVKVVVSCLFLVIFVGLLKFVEDWFELEARKKELENEQLTSELRFLRAQINPHFLFNTLNNLYYLAFTNSPNTAEVIAKLSQMMRYMLYESNHQRVSLSKEIEYMQNYISLEQLRLNHEVPISFEVEGTTDGVMIAPLIFITFLENAFKHGVSSANPNSWVKAKITANDKSCIYTVANSKMTESGKTVREKSGIGLQNVQRRLDLSYPQNFELTVENEAERYSISLKLKVA